MVLLGLNALEPPARTLWISLCAALFGLHAAVWFLPVSAIAWPAVGTFLLAWGVVSFSLFPTSVPAPHRPLAASD